MFADQRDPHLKFISSISHVPNWSTIFATLKCSQVFSSNNFGISNNECCSLLQDICVLCNIEKTHCDNMLALRKTSKQKYKNKTNSKRSSVGYHTVLGLEPLMSNFLKCSKTQDEPISSILDLSLNKQKGCHSVQWYIFVFWTVSL